MTKSTLQPNWLYRAIYTDSSRTDAVRLAKEYMHRNPLIIILWIATVVLFAASYYSGKSVIIPWWGWIIAWVFTSFMGFSSWWDTKSARWPEYERKILEALYSADKTTEELRILFCSELHLTEDEANRAVKMAVHLLKTNKCLTRQRRGRTFMHKITQAGVDQLNSE